MTITGIVAEFNPFHNGHEYLLSQAEGVKIVAMSGNYVQRGEPAVVDKWTRAEMALRNGEHRDAGFFPASGGRHSRGSWHGDSR